MKCATLALALAATAFAQDISTGIPKCAVSCPSPESPRPHNPIAPPLRRPRKPSKLTAALQEECVNTATVGSNIGGCSQGDIKCICSNDEFLDNIACCLSSACDSDGKDKAVSFARSICGGAGVDVPDQVVCNNPSAASVSGAQGPEETGDSDDDDSAGARAVPVLGGIAAVLAAMAIL